MIKSPLQAALLSTVFCWVQAVSASSCSGSICTIDAVNPNTSTTSLNAQSGSNAFLFTTSPASLTVDTNSNPYVIPAASGVSIGSNNVTNGNTVIFSVNSMVDGTIGDVTYPMGVTIQNANVSFGDVITGFGNSFVFANGTNGTAIFQQGVLLDSNIITGTNGNGTLILNGSNILNGSIGTNTNSLQAILVAGDVLFQESVSAGIITIAKNASAILNGLPLGTSTALGLADSASVIFGDNNGGAILGGNNTLTTSGNNNLVIFEGGGSVAMSNFNLPGTNAQIQVNATGTSTPKNLMLQSQSVTVNQAVLMLAPGGQGTLSLQDGLGTAPGSFFTGNITTQNNDQDIVTVGPVTSGNTAIYTIIGNVGTSGNKFLDFQVAPSTVVTVTGNIFADNVVLLGDSMATPISTESILTVNGNITGSITTSNNNSNNLILPINANVPGSVGVSGTAFNTVTLNGGVTGQFAESIWAQTLVISSGATAQFGKNVTTTHLNLNGISNAIFQEDNVMIAGSIMGPQASITLNNGGLITDQIHSLASLNVASQGIGVVTLQNANNAIGTTLISNNGTLNLAALGSASATLTGNIQTQDNHQGSLALSTATLPGIYSIIGNVAASNASLNQFTLPASMTAIVTGDVYADNILLSGALGASENTLTVGGNLTGALTTMHNGANKLFFQGNTNFSGSIGQSGSALNSVTVNGAATWNSSASMYVNTFAVNNAATLTILAGNSLNLSEPANTFTLSPGAQLAVSLTSTAPANYVNTIGIANVGLSDNDTTITILSTPFQSNTYTLIQGGAGSALHKMNVANNNSLFVNYATEVVGNNLNLMVTFSQNTLANLANQPNTIGVGATLNAITLNTPIIGGVLGNILSSLASYTNAIFLNEALATIAPNVDGGMMQTSLSLPFSVMHLMNLHLNERHLQPMGYSAGDKAPCQTAWLKTFGETGHQQSRDGIQGYNESVWGVVIGSDIVMWKNSVIGTAFSQSALRVRSALAGDKTKANSTQLALYGEVNFTDTWYLNAVASLAYNDYTTSHHLSVENVSLFAQGHYHAWQPAFQIEIGYDYVASDAHFIPSLSVYYTNLNLSAYTETGAGNANQWVNGNTFQSLLAGGGLQVITDFPWQESIYEPEAHVKVFYDFINDRMQTTSQFIGAGPAFTSTGIKPPATRFDLGFSLTQYGQDGLSFAFSYDFSFEENYSQNSGFIRIQYEW